MCASEGVRIVTSMLLKQKSDNNWSGDQAYKLYMIVDIIVMAHDYDACVLHRVTEKGKQA